jgi:hypothetical protein
MNREIETVSAARERDDDEDSTRSLTPEMVQSAKQQAEKFIETSSRLVARAIELSNPGARRFGNVIQLPS